MSWHETATNCFVFQGLFEVVHDGHVGGGASFGITVVNQYLVIDIILQMDKSIMISDVEKSFMFGSRLFYLILRYSTIFDYFEFICLLCVYLTILQFFDNFFSLFEPNFRFHGQNFKKIVLINFSKKN